MAEDVVFELNQTKPCCASLKERFTKLEVKRNALRQAVKLLELEIEKLQTENLNLKKSYEEERSRAELERELKDKESDINSQLEKDICKLKSEISLLQKTRSSKPRDEGGNGQLETRVLEQEAEINRLKELLGKEKKRGDSEKKKAEAEKKKAAEAWIHVKTEKSKAEEEKRLANIEKNKAGECRVSLETLKIEAKEAREKMMVERSKVEEANRRIEAEKKRANREKKHTDSAMAKAEEQRKCAEADRKKAMDEKTRADNLTQQLVEERTRAESLQKEMQAIISAGQESSDFLCSGAVKCHSVVADGNVKTETVNKALKEKLRVAKMQVKLAKRMTKLEKAQKNLLREELFILKQDAVQFSHRLNVLDDCFSRGIEGIDGLAKTVDSSKLKSFNLKNQVSGMEALDLYCQRENKLAKTTNAFDCFGQAIERTGSLPPISGGSCTKLSGISSELESLIGGSVRNTSQNSAMYSTTASFSDRRLVGSQGKCVFSIPRSSNLAEENPKQNSVIARLCNEATKMRHIENLGMLAENNDGTLVSRKSASPCLTSTLHDRNRNADRMTGHSRKKRRIHDALESVIHLYSEDKKLHLQMEDGLSALHDILSLKNNLSASILSQSDGHSTPLGNERSLVSKPLDNSYIKNSQSSKKKKVVKEHKRVSPISHQDGKQRHKDKLEIGGSGEALFHTGTTLSANQIRETVQCGDETTDAFGSDRATLDSFESMFCGDYMKLLELDDPADEERYRMAMEMPLSPTLPEIDFPILEASETDDINYLAEMGLRRGFEIEEDNLLPSRALDVVDIEIDSNKFNCKIYDSPMGPSSHKIAASVHSDEEAIGSDMNTSHSGFKKIHILYDNEHVSSIRETGAPVAVKQIYEARKSHDSNVHHSPSILELEGSRGQSRPSLQCFADAEVIPKAMEVDNIISVETGISLSSGNVNYSLSKSGSDSVSYLQEEPTQNYGLGNFSLVGNTISPLKEPNEALVTTQAIYPGSSKHQVEGKGKKSEDLFFSQSVNDYSLLKRTKSLNDEDYFLKATEAPQTSLYQVLESGSKMEVAKPMPILNIEEPKVQSLGNDGLIHHISKYSVVFSNTNEKGSIFRVFHATDTCISRCSMVSQTDWVVATALLALSLEQDLLSEEKACVFFSLLLHNYSVVALANSRSFVNGHSSICSDSFAGQINKVIADAETRCLFLELCRLDILLSLIEDFLIDRNVIVHCDVLCEPLVPHDSSGEVFLLDGEKMFLSYRTATVDQLVAGSLILASICEAVDHVGFLCEASYNILRTCKNDSSWNNLMVVHVFVSICGKKYFDLSDYSLVITAIKSVVSLLEKRDEPVGNIPPCLPSVNDNQNWFSPCTQCPFAEGAVCVDNVILLLLEKLQGYAVSGIRDQNLKKSTTSSIFTVLPLTERSEGILEHESDLDGLSINCDKSYSLKNRRVVAPKSNCVADTTSCFFSDIASAVELLACYISWDWTYNKIIPCLLKMLESCVSEEFSAAILTLVGQLGRLGVDAGGYNQNGIEELRCSLSVFLDLNAASKWGLPTQLASVNSLVGLLSLDLGELIQNSSVLPLDLNQAAHAILIRKWFSELSKEQRSQILSLFQSADVQKN